MEKKCKVCGESKDIDDFPKAGFHKNTKEQYYRPECKICREKNRDHRREYNPEYHKQWREKNREKLRGYWKEYYYSNKDKYKRWYTKWYAKNRERIIEGRKSKWIEIIKTKFDLECSQCRYNKCFRALDFHHLNSETKEIDIATLMTRHPSEAKIKILLEELEKVILVCANCHREIHDGCREIN